jgi:transposase-like protein
LGHGADAPAIGAEKGERAETRLSCRSGYYGRSLITRVGTMELRVPQDRLGRFSTELFRCLADQDRTRPLVLAR